MKLLAIFRNIKPLEVKFLNFNLINSIILAYMSTYLMQPIVTKMFNIAYLFSIVFCYIFLVNILLFFLLFRNARAYYIISYLLIVISFIGTYFSYKFGVKFDATFIQGIIMADASVGDVLTFKDVLYIISFSVIVLVLFLKVKIKKHKKQIRGKIASILVILFLLFVYFIPRLEQDFDNENLILLGKSQSSIIAISSYIFNTVYYLNLYSIVHGTIENNFSQSQNLNPLPNDLYAKDGYDNVKSILFLADTVRAKNLSIFGYDKPTTVELQKLENTEKGNLFAVQSQSCFTSSYTSINCLLSFISGVKTREDISGTINTKHKTQYYADILGYNTTFVRAPNTGAYNLEQGFKEFFSDKHTKGALNYKILPLFFNSIKEGEKQFVFGYIRGAHYLYNEATEPYFEKFPNAVEGSENAYNNKLVQIDYTWSEIIKKMKNYPDPVFLIFTSDHGESLGEIHNGRKFILHSAEYDIAPPEQLHVPFIVYVNDKYKEMYPDMVQIISKNLQQYKDGNKKILSDVISHSLLSCSGSEGDWINKKLSICSEEFEG